MPILEVRNLTKSYSPTSGIFHFDLRVDPSDIVLLLGPNGAGKTTAFRGILGLTNTTSEKVQILDKRLTEEPSEYLKNVGAMVSKPVFYEYLTGQEHLEMLTQFYDHVNSEKVCKIFKAVGLDHCKRQRVSTYSSGMKQRLDLARAMIHEPQLLILDEPFNGMDIEAKSELKKGLIEMQKQTHMGIVISSHMVGDLERFANRLVILYQGRVLYNGLMENVHKSGLNLEEFYLEKLNHYKNGGSE